MEVTKSNFSTVLPSIKQAIENCTFISIDCELTGLNMTTCNVNAFDTPKQYYEKVSKNSKDFNLIQYGLSIFRHDKEQNVFKHQSYNFYLFRRPVQKYIPDHRFLCQSSSIDFLINQGFDFNKLFKEGISYLSIVEERELKAELETNRQPQRTLNIIPIPDNVQPFMDDVLKRIDKFLENDSQTEMQLPKCTSFVRRLIYQTIQEKYSKTVILETRQVERDRILFVTRVKSPEDLEGLAEKKRENTLRELQEAAGFLRVMLLVSRSRKLVIGHNMVLDLLHTIDKFFTPLPSNYTDFKNTLHTIFPNVLDTKYMSSIEPFKELILSNVLKSLFDTVTIEPFELPLVEVENGAQGYHMKEAKEHEAGYDAFITGISFLSMWKFLGISEGLSDEATFSNFALLAPYTNRVFLMKLTDNQFMHLTEDEITPSRDHVFHLTFPKEWKASNIFQLFSPFGSIQVAWIDDSSAYVALNNREQVHVAFKCLSKTDRIKIMRFADLNQNVRAKKPVQVALRRRKSSKSEDGSSQKRAKSQEIEGGSTILIEKWRKKEECSDRKIAKTFPEDDRWE